MGVVKESTEGSHLVGACDVTGLWPKKFTPATMTIDDFHSAAAKERELQSHLHVGVGPRVRRATDFEGGRDWGPCSPHQLRGC